jgi:hypothetical protein
MAPIGWQRGEIDSMATRTRAIPPQPRQQAPEPVQAPACRDDVIRAMARMLSLRKPGTTAEALKTLRHAYPDYPLALRRAALAAATK